MAANIIFDHGFDCEFIEKLPDQVQSECNLCKLVLREPHQVNCCEKNFCQVCFKKREKKNECPDCKEIPIEFYHNKVLQKQLYQYKVRCSHQKDGCEWTGELGELDSHLNLHALPDKRLNGCPLVKVKCTHCSVMFQRKAMPCHQQECPQRPFTCPYCREKRSTFVDIETNHWPECKCYPVVCPNECGEEFQRQNIENHVANDCPLILVECEYSYAGCKVKLPRKDMKEHLSVDMVNHMSMIAANHKQEREEDKQTIRNLEAKISQLEEKNQVLETRNNIIVSSHNRPPLQLEIGRNSNSAPFYTGGYKFCVRFSVISRKEGLFTCSSRMVDYKTLQLHIMNGEFDSELNWPFSCQVTVQLLRQDRSWVGKDLRQTVQFRDLSKPRDGMSGPYDSGILIPSTDYSSKYEKNDVVKLKILEVKLT